MRTAIALTAWSIAITALTWTTYQISLKLAIFVGTIAIPIALIEIALSRIEQTNRGR